MEANKHTIKESGSKMLTILSKEGDQERIHGEPGRDINSTWVFSSGPIHGGAEHPILRVRKIDSIGRER